MSTAFAIRTIIELAAILFVIYGVLNEKKFIDFEDKVIKKFKRYIRKRKVARNQVESSKFIYAEGNYTAKSNYAHAEGNNTTAKGAR